MNNIENIVFDVGQVLLTFQPEKFLSGFTDDEREVEKISSAVFRSSEWLNLDRGSWSRQEAADFFRERLPEYGEIIEKAVLNWTDMLKPIDENIELMQELKSQGYPVYVLSNFPEEGYRKAREEFSFWRHFDGIVISALEGYVKPEAEIYQVLLSRYNLKPEKTIFIDDSEKNIKGAKSEGIIGIEFNEPAELRKELADICQNEKIKALG